MWRMLPCSSVRAASCCRTTAVWMKRRSTKTASASSPTTWTSAWCSSTARLSTPISTPPCSTEISRNSRSPSTRPIQTTLSLLQSMMRPTTASSARCRVTTASGFRWMAARRLKGRPSRCPPTRRWVSRTGIPLLSSAAMAAGPCTSTWWTSRIRLRLTMEVVRSM